MNNRFYSSGFAKMAAALVLTLIATRALASPFQAGDILYTDSFGAVFSLNPATLTGATVALFNPRTRSWWDHFAWADDGIGILGTSPIGRATVGALYLSDDPDALAVRSYRVLAGWHPPRD